MNEYQFAPRELCEKLSKMGCISESGFYWTPDMTLPIYHRQGWIVKYDDEKSYCFVHDEKDVPVFVQNDFTGATAQARENAKIIWPGCFTESAKVLEDATGIHYEEHMAWRKYRAIMIDLADEKWFDFLKRTMKGDPKNGS